MGHFSAFTAFAANVWILGINIRCIRSVFVNVDCYVYLSTYYTQGMLCILEETSSVSIGFIYCWIKITNLFGFYLLVSLKRKGSWVQLKLLQNNPGCASKCECSIIHSNWQVNTLKTIIIICRFPDARFFIINIIISVYPQMWDCSWLWITLN